MQTAKIIIMEKYQNNRVKMRNGVDIHDVLYM